VQYLYKIGYDPGAAVSFFEKLQAKESAKPGTVSKMFSTHPPTGDRIAMSKKNIELICQSRLQRSLAQPRTIQKLDCARF